MENAISYQGDFESPMTPWLDPIGASPVSLFRHTIGLRSRARNIIRPPPADERIVDEGYGMANEWQYKPFGRNPSV